MIYARRIDAKVAKLSSFDLPDILLEELLPGSYQRGVDRANSFKNKVGIGNDQSKLNGSAGVLALTFSSTSKSSSMSPRLPPNRRRPLPRWTIPGKQNCRDQNLADFSSNTMPYQTVFHQRGNYYGVFTLIDAIILCFLLTN